MPFPCDQYGNAIEALYRGVTVNAPASTIYRGLCQMRKAPYSYDWIDNAGRKSPQHLIEGLDQLARGQAFMSIFVLADFEKDSSVTIAMHEPHAKKIFGEWFCSYLIVPNDKKGCRLLVKLAPTKYPRGLYGMVETRLFPWVDLIMMRRQLLNFKSLSETAS